MKNSHIHTSKIIKERLTTDLTQKEVAENYEVDRSTVSKHEGNFKDEVAEKFLSKATIKEISEWIKSEYEFELDEERIEDILISHEKVPNYLV